MAQRLVEETKNMGASVDKAVKMSVLLIDPCKLFETRK